MEDLDPPREEPGAARQILNSLQQHGLHWHGEVLWQSSRDAAYREALASLRLAGELFSCDCTRAMLGPGGSCAGRCRPRQTDIGSPHATRIEVPAGTVVSFADQLQGIQAEELGALLPDFVLQRKDDLYAYQLAVVVDDGFQEITHVVRGSDLLDSTGRQIYLQQRLGYPTPHYLHLPVITNSEGQKFSKQNHAPALDGGRAPDNLRQALQFLGQTSPPTEMKDCSDILTFAARHWSPSALPRQMAVSAECLGAAP